MITIDNMASRYHLLPSQALAQANTFDLQVLNTSTLWEQHKQELADKADQSQYKTFGGKADAPSEDVMKKMMAIAKAKKNGNKGKR